MYTCKVRLRKMFAFVVCSVLCFLSTAQTAVLPVEKCQLSDSNCLTSAFQQALPVFMAGLPDHEVEVEDVLEMDPVAFDLSGLKFNLPDGRLKGLKNSVIDKVKWSQKKNKFEVDFHANATVKGHYTASGRILILPITGDGQLVLKLKNIAVSFIVDYDISKNAEGQDIIVPNKYDFQFEVKDNAHFTLTGLFNGNKELSDTMHLFLNENWKQISAEFGRPLMEATAKKLYKNISNFFKHSPINEIAEVTA